MKPLAKTFEALGAGQPLHQVRADLKVFRFLVERGFCTGNNASPIGVLSFACGIELRIFLTARFIERRERGIAGNETEILSEGSIGRNRGEDPIEIDHEKISAQ